MSGLAAVVAGLGLGSLGALARDVSALATVEALLLGRAVARQVADAAAGVAGLGRSSERSGGAEVSSSVGLALGLSSVAVGALALVLGAVARDVANLVALVALLSSAGGVSSAEASGSGLGVLGALAREVALVAALVASLGLALSGAVAREVTLLRAVVAGRGSGLGAGRGKVTLCKWRGEGEGEGEGEWRRWVEVGGCKEIGSSSAVMPAIYRSPSVGSLAFPTAPLLPTPPP